MIKQRLGNTGKADYLLAAINEDSTIIETESYADLCKLFKRLLPLDSFIKQGPRRSLSNDAVRYAIANWHLYHGDTSKAR